MRKITLLTTAALLSIAFMGNQKLTADAAFQNSRQQSVYGNRIIISNVSSKLPGVQGVVGIRGDNCNIDIDSLLQEFIQNLPSKRPCPPVETPDTETPDNKPDNTPDNSTPDNKPDNTPDNSTPDNKPDNTPDNSTPDNKPDNTPDNSTPDNKPDNTPDNSTPDNKPDNTPDNKPDNTPDNDNTDNETPDTENQSYVEQVVSLVNIERAKEGLAPLTIDKNVQAAAQVRALEIETAFSHTRPNGTSFATALKEQNVSYRSAGENIAWGQRSPQEVVTAWMNSEGHRANIMNANFTKIGVGYHRNARGTNYWSQLFIR